MANSGYSEVERILAQIFIAFGQGAGCIRVRRVTVDAIRERYLGLIEKFYADWETEAVEVLERVRTVGRLAGVTATGRGASEIEPEDFDTGSSLVERHGFTRWCEEKKR